MRIAQHERHRHGLAERAPQSKKDAADHGRARVGQDNIPDDFPTRRAQCVRGFLQATWHGQEDFAHDRRDERNHHDRQHQSRGEHAQAERWPCEQRANEGPLSQLRIDPRIDVLGQHRHQHEQAPHAVDDRRDAGEKFDRGANRTTQPPRCDFGQEHCNAEADRHCDDHRDQCSDEGPVNRYQRAELPSHRIPFVRPQEADAELRECRAPTPQHRQRGPGERHQHEHASRRDEPAKAAIDDVIAMVFMFGNGQADGVQAQAPRNRRRAGRLRHEMIFLLHADDMWMYELFPLPSLCRRVHPDGGCGTHACIGLMRVGHVQILSGSKTRHAIAITKSARNRSTSSARVAHDVTRRIVECASSYRLQTWKP